MSNNRNMNFDTVQKFVADIDTAQTEVLAVLARWHDAGQSHWLGGEAWDNPDESIRAAFASLRDANAALSAASHELVMYSLGAKV